jgi:hypothetical protein
MSPTSSFSIVRRFLRVVFALVLVLPWIQADAHEIRPAVVDLDLQPGNYTLRIQLNLEALMAEIAPEHGDTDESANAPRYDALRAMGPEDLADAFADYRDTFLANIQVTDAEGRTVVHQVAGLEIPPVGDPGLSRDTVITLAPANFPPGGEITWAWQASYGASIIRVNSQGGEAEEDQYSAYLEGGGRSRPIPLDGDIGLGYSEVVRNYVAIGFTHILPLGLDHILFVMGLFLLSPALRPLLIQVTSFTVAHTVTLALGSLGLVRISPDIVEPLIAASIVYVAVENILSDRLQRWRPLVVFGFGLLHGLGFAGVLADVGIAGGFFLSALISFNIGVELGQLAVIALCFLLFGYWFRKRPWYRARITIPLSLLVGLAGAYWFVERTLMA